MSLSQAARAFAQHFPGPTRALLSIWAALEVRDPDHAHWLFMELKDRADLRLQREARLYDGQRLMVDPFDSVGCPIYCEGCYEPETVRVFRALLKRNGVVVDAGADVGQYTLIAARAVGPNGQVHALEPDPQTFALLEGNIARNAHTNVRTNALALGDEPGLAPLHLAGSGNIGGNSLAHTDCSGDASIDDRIDALDRYFEGARYPDLFKADVEGAELPLLRGSEGILLAACPHLLIELSTHTRTFGNERTDLVASLADRDYVIYQVGPLPLTPLASPDRGADWYNALAVHRSRCNEPNIRGLLDDRQRASGDSA